MEITTIPRIIQKNVRDYPNHVAQYSKDNSEVFQPATYTELYNEILSCAAGLREAGIRREDHVGFISDNRKEWLILDMGLHCLGAADVPRGCDSMAEELSFILSFGDCKSAVLENEAQLVKLLPLRDKMPQLAMFIIIDNDFDKEKYSAALSGIRVLGYRDIMEQGKALIEKGEAKSIEAEIEQGKGDDLATIIFTSGTTGEPKGVMLSHKNILHIAAFAPQALHNGPGEIWLTVLPVWHSFERCVQYIALYPGGALAYSKPLGKIMLADFQKIQPTWLTSVPRIWEALRAGVYRNVSSGSAVKKGIFNFFVAVSGIHENLKNTLLGRAPQFKRRFVPFDMLVSVIPFLLLSPLRGLGNSLVFKKIKAMFGGNFRAGVSGGGALPNAVDKFFAAAGVLVLEGYGITEAAPVLAVRHYNHPVPGTIGPPFPDMELIIRDPESGKELPPGKPGILHGRGEQIMQGYYKKPELTQKAIDGEGWLNTGDIGLKTWKGEIKITGRAKDTIVLLGGENIEPVPIENKIRESEYIDLVVVLGQDQKFLAALVIPDFERIEAYAKENFLPYIDTESLVKMPEIRELIHAEITERVNRKTGFRGFEMIFRSAVLAKPFRPGVELSGKQDLKRHVINDIYKKEIAELFADS
ncbi:MAG: AMP-binding protein [Spirochaetaceae bacterium]|jgi:long-chain acyl-CoA synthetase|nr:AMP-binding protein [Spirochaetaceae bacterium]